MAWRRPGDKPLPEPMLVSLLTHICVTRPQWVNINATMDEKSHTHNNNNNDNNDDNNNDDDDDDNDNDNNNN